MKKLRLLTACAMTLLSMPSLVSCDNTLTLTVYNAADYIDEGTDGDGNTIEGRKGSIAAFEEWYEKETGTPIKVNYQNYSTIEEMYTKIEIGQIKPDLVCSTDYVILKMRDNNMLEPYGFDENTNLYGSELQNVNDNLSPYLKKVFKKNGFSNWAVPYFWGTIGITYNPEVVDEESVKSWNFQWNPLDKEGNLITGRKISIKDSVRATYFTGVMRVYHDELMSYLEQYKNGTLDADTYNSKVSEVFNRSDAETVNKVKKELEKLDGLVQLEVDDGKNEMIKGNLVANLAWSGDAVYAMNGGEPELNLKYYVPEEGSDMWLDAWSMCKGANVEASKAFVNFFSSPEIAANNMEATGYTSPLSCDSIWNLVKDMYDAGEDSESNDVVDLSYFFGENHFINIPKSERGRQFDTQYPDEDTLARCVIQRDFGDEGKRLVDNMWTDFKTSLL